MLSLLGTAFVACLSPTLPLPPPEEPDSVAAATEEGYWNVRGSCIPGTVVLVKNLNTGVITGIEDKESDGRYLIRVQGEVCDHAEVFQIDDTTTSDTTFFVLETTVNGIPEGECAP